MIPARPTVYRGIQMRSRLEATMAGKFDAIRITWEYEPRCYADGERQYLPDFEFYADGELTAVVEVKPFLTDIEAERSRMEPVLASVSDVFLMIVTPTEDEDQIYDPDLHRWNSLSDWLLIQQAFAIIAERRWAAQCRS